MDLAKFISLLKDKCLYMSRLDNLRNTDKHEGTINKKTIEKIKTLYQVEVPEEFLRNYEDSGKKTYACCWHLNELESEAMWRLYNGNDNHGIAIQTTYEKLKKVAEDARNVRIGRVKYLDFDKDILKWTPRSRQ